jgi:hypothetical protein
MSRSDTTDSSDDIEHLIMSISSYINFGDNLRKNKTMKQEISLYHGESLRLMLMNLENQPNPKSPIKLKRKDAVMNFIRNVPIFRTVNSNSSEKSTRMRSRSRSRKGGTRRKNRNTRRRTQK